MDKQPSTALKLDSSRPPSDLSMLKLIVLIEQLPKQSKYKILEFLRDINIKISESSDGSRVNLDTLNPFQLSTLINYAQSLVVEIPEEFKI